MRPRHPRPDHQAAVARRLALLGEELAAARPDPSQAAWPAAGDDPERPWWEGHTRVAGAPPSTAAPGPEPGQLDAPGRHAARRVAAGEGRELGGAVAGRWRDRLLLGPAQLTVVAVVVAAALAVTCWWLVRGDPSGTARLGAAPAAGLVPLPSGSPTAAAPAAEATGSSGPSGSAVPGGDRASPATVTVDVAGKVRHPGIEVLDAGARVADALEAAGGARPGVDLTGLNLAQVLADGQQVLVGVAAAPGVAAAAAGEPSPPSGAASGPTQLVDLNTATAAQLDTLPDVGPVTAASILSWRDAHGGFTSVDELLEVDGIGEVTLGKIAPYVTV